MAHDELGIVNGALIELGQDTIASLDLTIKAARIMKTEYPKHRDQMLERYRWTFTIDRQILTPEATAPAFGFTYKYLLPVDTIAFLGIYDENEPQNNYTSTRIPSKVENGFLLVDEGPTVPVFLRLQKTDPTQFSHLFARALELDLAIHTEKTLTGTNKLRPGLVQQFRDTIASAKLTDAIQTDPETIVASEWVDSRNEFTPFRPGPIV